jgi:hypothetical protein
MDTSAYDATSRRLRGAIIGAREDGSRDALVRYLATYAFLAPHGADAASFSDRLALAAYEVFQTYATLPPECIVEARIALLGLPARADEVMARIDAAWPAKPTAEFVTTFNLAALLAHRSESIRPIPGRRTDVAAAILAGRISPLTRLIGLDVHDVGRYGFGNTLEPDGWYPMFAALICTAADQYGLHLTFSVPGPD